MHPDYQFQSQTRSQSPGDGASSVDPPIPRVSFNRRREANPLATRDAWRWLNRSARFQSQTRSQSPGDFMYSLWKKSKKTVSIADAKPIPWRLRPDFKVQEEIAVSIADAKPIPWRRLYLFTDDLAYFRFNRRREANPLATLVSLHG